MVICESMKTQKNRTADLDLLVIELLNRQDSIEAHLHTLFMMQCELFAYVNKSDSKLIAEQWGNVRMDFLKQKLADTTERLRELTNQR